MGKLEKEMSKGTVCLSGITGQVGSWMAEILLSEGYKVYGLKRRSSSLNTQRIDHIFNNPNLKLVYGDLTDQSSINNFIGDVKPDIFINCGAQSHVKVSFEIPLATMEATGVSVMNCLEAIRKTSPKTRFVTMSSSEMFGSANAPQNENTPFQPCSPYAVAKITGYYATINYRNAFNLFASNAICFNTEGSRRGETFVTRKITLGASRIKLGLQDKLYLGNLESLRDWSNARDTCDALFKIVNHYEPDDFVVASGISYSIKEFAERVFNKLGMNYKDYVEFDARYLREQEVDHLCGDSSKIRNKLGWEPKYSLDDTINEMVDSDMKLVEQELLIRNGGK